MPPATTTTTVALARSRDSDTQKPQLKSVNADDSLARQELSQSVSRRAPLPSQQAPVSKQLYAKKVPHRSSKPIINWFQRKLGGSVRARRFQDGDCLNVAKSTVPNPRSHLGVTTTPASRPNGRSFSSPWPQAIPPTSHRQDTLHHYRRGVPSAVSQRRTISLNDVDTEHNQSLFSADDDNMDGSTRRSSLARDSMWSPASALEADEDASLRPLPPSSPPSPSLSHSSSSYISHPRTFRSIAASTKPTTVLSIDLPPAGVGHIAQVPATPASQISPRHALHARSSSTGTNGGLVGGVPITFSAFSPSPHSTSHPPSLTQSNFASSNPVLLGQNVHGLQAPLHTAHHPRNNPRPSSPPPDNASMLTLASSAYAIPGARMVIGSLGSATLSGLLGGGDSISHLGGSVLGDPEGENTSQFLPADDDRLDVEERDVDASVRALRPRSSRRGSWDSEVSGWSAKILGNGPGMTTGNKNIWMSNSMKTGWPVSLDDGDDEKVNEIMAEGGAGAELTSEPEDRGVPLTSEFGGDNDRKQAVSGRHGTRELNVGMVNRYSGFGSPVHG